MGEQFELEVGEKLKLLQQRKGYSDQALAKMSGLSVNTLKAVFASSKGTLHGNYTKVASALDVSIKFTVE